MGLWDQSLLVRGNSHTQTRGACVTWVGSMEGSGWQEQNQYRDPEGKSSEK